MPSTLYTSQDAGAITDSLSLQGTGQNKLINILKACLVNGYTDTSKAGAGWSLAFEDAPSSKAAFQMGAGSSQFYLQLTGSDARLTRLDPYQTMAAIDTGSKGLWASDFHGHHNAGYSANLATDTAPIQWALVADVGYFFLASVSAKDAFTQAVSVMFFGDLDTAPVTIANPVALMCTGTTTNGVSVLSYGAQHFATNDSLASTTGIMSLFAGHNSTATQPIEVKPDLFGHDNTSFSHSVYPYPDVLTGGLVARKAQILSRETNLRIGALPGVLQPLNITYPGQSGTWARDVSGGNLYRFVGKAPFLGLQMAIITGQVTNSAAQRLAFIMFADQ